MLRTKRIRPDALHQFRSLVAVAVVHAIFNFRNEWLYFLCSRPIS